MGNCFCDKYYVIRFWLTAEKGPIDEMQFVQYLNTANIPDPELLIRTSGEHRISNFYCGS